MIPWLERDTPFPTVSSALKDPNGLLAAGADLSSERLLEAYRHGIFPWFSEGDPILWWSPDPRMILFPAELQISRSLGKTLRNRSYEARFDSVFGESMFSRVRDASKIALAALVAHLESAGFGLIDCQMHTRHLETLGAREIPRRRFSRLLEELIHYPNSPGSWSGASVAQVQCRS